MVAPHRVSSTAEIQVLSRVSLDGAVESTQGGSKWYHRISYATWRRLSTQLQSLSAAG
jgi:hypothetical protein